MAFAIINEIAGGERKPNSGPDEPWILKSNRLADVHSDLRL
jgi:hypothetical protein